MNGAEIYWYLILFAGAIYALVNHTLWFFGIAIAVFLIYFFYYLPRQKKQTIESRARSAYLREMLHLASKERLLDPVSNEKRPRDWDIRRKFVIERDGGRCTVCGSTKNLQVHHIVPVKIRIDHSGVNLKTLCVNCHALED